MPACENSNQPTGVIIEDVNPLLAQQADYCRIGKYPTYNDDGFDSCVSAYGVSCNSENIVFSVKNDYLVYRNMTASNVVFKDTNCTLNYRAFASESRFIKIQV